MPSDRELDQAATDLQRFRVSQEQQTKSQDDILQQYQTLIQDYRRLQADYDEARDSRDNYKRLSKGAERNPFALVLIDGDGYIFDDHLVGGGVEGGSKAAQLLNDAVKRSLAAKGLEDCRIMVRVYADLVALSKAVSKVKLCGAEKRALAPFAASFTRTNELFDFVDAGELKENTDFKLRALLRQFIDNTQCRHIYFAGCHDVGYVSELMPHVNQRDRITLVHNHAFQQEFQKLGLPTEHLLPNVFRTTPLGEQSSTKPTPLQASNGATPSDSAPICFFFQKGRCTYGSGCKNRHVKAAIDDIKDWRQKSSTPHAARPVGKSDHDSMGSRPDSRRSMTQEFDQVQRRWNDSPHGNGHARTQSFEAEFEALPRPEEIPRNKIAINRHSKRLDPYMSTTPEERAAFLAYVAKGKLCNNLHLTGRCPNPQDCKYDHCPIDEVTRKCLRAFAFNTPCDKNQYGSCRNVDCNHGHVCQRSDCRFRGGKSNCRFPSEVHTIDYHATDFVDGLQEEHGDLMAFSGSYSTTPSTRSDYGSGYANGKAVKSLETEAHDDIDVLVDTVRTGPTQEALRYAGSNEEQDQEPDDTPTWDGRW